MSEKTDYWISLAERDVPTAKVNLKGKQYLWVGFLCHLIVEKSLKAVIADITDEIPPKIHKLTRLAELAGMVDELSESQRSLLNTLTPMHIEAQYEDNKNTIRKKFTPQGWKNLLSETEEFLCMIKKKLGR